MKVIKSLTEDIKCNIKEAREKIITAYSLRDKDRCAADWYRDMAVQHLDFNKTGHACVSRIISTLGTNHSEDRLYPGMMAVYEDMHADIIRETAEVRAMISEYK